jgi:hypothetical protein
LDVKFHHEKLEIYLFIGIWNHGNHGTWFLFNTHECQEIKIKNPFDPILGFNLVWNFWKWKILSLKKDIFTKDSYNKSKLMVKKWYDNNMLNTF